MGKAFALYSGLRLLAFVGTYGLMLIVGLRSLVAIAAAVLVSSVISLLTLRRQRDAVSAALDSRRGSRQREQARLRGLLDDEPSADGH